MTSTTTKKIEVGDIVTLLPPHHPVKFKITKRNKGLGSLTATCIEPLSSYAVGDTIIAFPYDFKHAT